MKRISHLSEIKSLSKYLDRIGAEPRSLRTAVVKEQRGNYWRDVAVIKVDKDGSIDAPQAFAPTDDELNLIKAECAEVEWPELCTLEVLGNLPEQLKNTDKRDLFEFRGEDNRIIMVQQRVETDTGKRYVPWTYWNDGQWRAMEPDGKLPLWGIDQLNKFEVVFIHEGAKAARAMAELYNDEEKRKAHPWGDELGAVAHLGWIGGALSPARTDWGVLARKGVKKAYIVSDNDEPGLAAVPNIAFRLRCPTYHIQFTGEWPPSFDLADDFPQKMFKEIDGIKHYVGPTMRSCMHPATWATDLIPNARGKPSYSLRESFVNQWAYIEEVDLFVHVGMPEIIRNEQIMNKMLAGFSHAANTSSLMVKAYRGRKSKLCYRPDIDSRIVTDRTTSAINLHTPTTVKPIDGDPKPFLEFMEYMVPDERERHEVLRWCATLIAAPGNRMEYGMLMVSETQGIGKTTLGSKILAPLVGEQNVGFPTERDIVESAFNGWLANKRLINVNEIYSGHSWKAYNTLKAYITDKDIEVNQKYLRPYRIENWAHVFASSNSRRALRMEQDDRRWFYPMLAEQPWPRERFAKLNEWLTSGGLGIILHWARGFGDYVSPGERAPMTKLKQQMIEDSRSPAASEFAALCDHIRTEEIECVLAMKDITAWVKNQVDGKVYDTDYELRKIAQQYGFAVGDRRIKVGSKMQYILISPAFQTGDRFNKSKRTVKNSSVLRENLVTPGSIMEESM